MFRSSPDVFVTYSRLIQFCDFSRLDSNSNSGTAIPPRVRGRIGAFAIAELGQWQSEKPLA
jgi:hypothetical protein